MGGLTTTRSAWRRTALIAMALVAQLLVNAASAIEPEDFDDGRDDTVACQDFRLAIQTFLGDAVIQDRSDEGWVWVDPTRRFREVTGVATRAQVSARDTAANHYSHDFNVDVFIDPGQEDLVSIVGKDESESREGPDTLEVEWETGVRWNEHRGNGADPFFPMWAWPSIGDRVWAEGNWVYDCGHADVPRPTDPDCVLFPDNDCNRYRSEIHPARAIASMRDQSRTLPGSGDTRVPVTATDLYIHGQGGFMTEQLHCGMDIILNHERCDTRTTPIAANYEFDVCIPPKPFATAQFSKLELAGPGNTVGSPDPVLDLVPASDACRSARWGGEIFADVPKFDPDQMMHVTVDLRGTGVADTEVYARRIYAGWVFPPKAPMRHFRVTLDGMDLEDDKDADVTNGDCECTFFWLNVNTAEAQGNPVGNEWIRMQDYTDANMNDYDDWHRFGDGEIDFTDADFEFYVRDLESPVLDELDARILQSTVIHANGYDQDCNDLALLGVFNISVAAYVDCFVGSGFFSGEPGREDAFETRHVVLQSSTYHGVDYVGLSGPGLYTLGSSADEYALFFTVSEIPQTTEDHADVGVTKSCATSGEVAVPGQPFTCTLTVTNHGPGLPRRLAVSDTFSSNVPDAFTIEYADFTVGDDPTTHACDLVSDDAISCKLGSLPVGATARVTVEVTPHTQSLISNTAVVGSSSTDTRASNNVATSSVEVFRPVTVVVKPTKKRGEVAAVYPAGGGLIAVAVLSTRTFDALTIDAATVCFGDAEDPAQRDCTESHGTGHAEDVNGDGRRDLLLHYDVAFTGIDPGDTSACLTGRTPSGGVYGCDAILTP